MLSVSTTHIIACDNYSCWTQRSFQDRLEDAVSLVPF